MVASMREIDDESECDAWISLGEARPPVAFQALDLRLVEGFETGSFRGCLFLSCQLTPAQAGYLTSVGATVIRDLEERPYSVHRAQLYTADELFAGFDPAAGVGYDGTFDARVYRFWVESGRQYPDGIDESLARRLHDHSITDALHEAVDGTRPVAIMGGHDIERADPIYAMVARVARALARHGRLMLSGGGPGAMEATHLGAWLAGHGDDALEQAIDVLSPRPTGARSGGEYTDPDWLDRAFTVRARWPIDLGVRRYESIGIPTWMYGHEPPNAFATMIAKYFANSVREEGLLAIATHGVVFAPGSAGTIQEIFQDAAQNHYSSFGPPSPMVLLGVDYWTEHHPVWAVLDSLSNGRDYRDLITITDDEQQVVDAIAKYHRAV
jgi:predicted Rossmann-fold nucleotide-binding protein